MARFCEIIKLSLQQLKEELAGQKFPKGGNFHNLHLNEKYNLGGRWNTGSSNRSGENIDPDEVASFIAENKDRLLSNSSSTLKRLI